MPKRLVRLRITFAVVRLCGTSEIEEPLIGKADPIVVIHEKDVQHAPIALNKREPPTHQVREPCPHGVKREQHVSRMHAFVYPRPDLAKDHLDRRLWPAVPL